MIAHRPSALAAVDHVLIMAEGRVQVFGPKDEVLSKVVEAACRSARSGEGREAASCRRGTG